MKNMLKKLGYILIIPLVVLTILLFPVYQSDAATLTAAYLMFSRMKAGLDGVDHTGTGGDDERVELYIAFETSGAVSADSTLTLEFPDGDDTNWCRTAGTDLTVSGVLSTPADSTGDFAVDSALPAQTALAAACTQGAGASDADTITITDLNGLTAGITYGVKVSNGTTAKLGTSSAGQKVVTLTVDDGTDPETMSFGINLVSDDEVDVTATVIDVQTVTCSLGSNSVNLGNLYKGGSYVTGTHTITTSTSSSAGGYYWSVYGYGNGSDTAGLQHESDVTSNGLIPSNNASNTVDISIPNSKGFGMNTTLPSGTTGGAGFSGNGDGIFGSVGYSSTNAELLLYQIGAQATSEDATITYGARADADNVAGSYSETVTFVCGGYY
jgi:hypothetical protein